MSKLYIHGSSRAKGMKEKEKAEMRAMIAG
jgi:hypothetical protein